MVCNPRNPLVFDFATFNPFLNGRPAPSCTVHMAVKSFSP